MLHSMKLYVMVVKAVFIIAQLSAETQTNSSGEE